MKTAHGELEALLGKIRAAAPSPKVSDLADAISILCRSFMEPAGDDRWNYMGLTVSECRILNRLLQRPGETVSRESLMDAVYFDRPDREPADKIIDIYISNLRKKLRGTEFILPNAKWGKGWAAFINHELVPKPKQESIAA